MRQTESKETSSVAPAVLTVRDVAAYLAVDEKTVYRLAQRGELPGFKVAGTWRFKQADIEAWIEKQKARSLRMKRKPDGR